jgi:hypothetical protein
MLDLQTESMQEKRKVNKVKKDEFFLYFYCYSMQKRPAVNLAVDVTSSYLFTL